jgi:hypothetical protein
MVLYSINYNISYIIIIFFIFLNKGGDFIDVYVTDRSHSIECIPNENDIINRKVKQVIVDSGDRTSYKRNSVDLLDEVTGSFYYVIFLL